MTNPGQRLQGRLALVTGASRGLGRVIARAFVEQGGTVILTARDGRAVQETAASLGERALGIQADVGDPAQVADLFGEIRTRFGKLDILINNAALGIPSRIGDLTDADLQAQMKCNLYGPIQCIRAAVPLMREAGGGEIVSVSSESVNMPFPMLAVYAATKAGLEALSRGLRSELALEHIRVSILRAGMIADTSFGDGWTAAQKQTAYEVWGKTGHLAMVAATGVGIQPSTIADAIVDMVTLPASGQIDLLELRAR
jgi:NAD(P)-dependent dehydrogenase (short-subunit alcohol dehydrogenase family)